MAVDASGKIQFEAVQDVKAPVIVQLLVFMVTVKTARIEKPFLDQFSFLNFPFSAEFITLLG